jgi:hypothetical protein
MLLAPGASGSGALRLPPPEGFPRLDERLVEAETREEMVRGRKVIAQPANPAHGDRHFELDYVVRAHIAPGYVGSSDLLTRVNQGSDFATDTCVRKAGEDPKTGARYLEELSFEVVNEQSLALMTEKAEDLAARGVRRIFAIFVKRREVREWSVKKGGWVILAAGKVITDRTLSQPIKVEALLDAAEADSAVVRALAAKKSPAILAIRAESKAEGMVEGKADTILAILAARGLSVSDDQRARILACADQPTLNRWIDKLLLASSTAELLAPE